MSHAPARNAAPPPQEEGITLLINMETEVEGLLAVARKEKQEKLKSAHEEAVNAVRQLRAQKEAEFQAHKREIAGSQEDFGRRIEEDAKAECEKLEKSFNERKAAAAALLVQAVLTTRE
eukprot:gnl/Spiro4/10333_TR5516_c0_g1_i1.p1 gnl/Spiro4/10333_TR5516_c0_g1~~gnl/Spiro4/10333_TR5516_c0_g1_i1.p1  ORF type:complete len:134 (+),score=38.70 gnl/Spiro4/10333_TR5516_c0_g1_i1:48-404(+)